MGANKQCQIQTGSFIVFFVVALILFLTGKSKIAWIIIVIGVIILGFAFIIQRVKQDKLGQDLDYKDVAQFKKSFSSFSTGDLKAIYAKRVTDEYQDEAIEAVRQILAERQELK
jgi:cell division protein FtsW (lipid II flippase)